MLDPKTTALVLIDLQKGVVGNPQLAPRPGSEVLASSIAVAEKFRAAGALVVLVRVAFAKDYADMPSRSVDQPMQLPAGGMPDEWSEFADGVERSGDLKVLKRQWGAFYGTNLDLELRRRGRKTIVLGGISTNFGVESTARDAWERNYQLVLVEDAMAARTAEDHTFAITRIFPRLGRICGTEDVVMAWS